MTKAMKQKQMKKHNKPERNFRKRGILPKSRSAADLRSWIESRRGDRNNERKN
jgi:hypothetical protein